MPRLSAFTPLGALRLTSKQSQVQSLYNALINSLGKNYRVTKGSREDGWCYAWARALSAARFTMQHAGLQISPPCVSEMMALREAEWQIVPGPFDSMAQRRAVLAARELLPRGARREAVTDALHTILDAAFVWYYTTKVADIATWPLSLGDQPQNLQLASVPRKRATITQPISIGLGSPQSVSFALADDGQPALLAGDVLTVEPEILTRAEVVTVASVTGTHFVATFNAAHDDGSVATTMPFPMWSSNQRNNLVITTAPTAVDPEARRKVSDQLERQLRAVSTWSIVAQSSPTTAGPFILGTSPLGATPFGIVTFP